MAWTYDTLKAAIQDFCENAEQSFVNNIPTFVQNAEERIMYSVDLEIYRKVATLTLTSGADFYTAPADFLSALSLRITETGKERYLINKDTEFVRDYNTPPTTDTPKYYAVYSPRVLLLAPTPDQDYAAELDYYYTPESIVTAGTTWIGDNAEQALLYASLVEAYTYMKGEADIIAQYTQRFTEALLRLKNFGEGRENVDVYRTGPIKNPVT